MNALEWNPVFGAVVFTVVALCVYGMFYILYRHVVKNHGIHKARVILAAKVVLIGMLLFALLDPVWKSSQGNSAPSKVLILRDISSSMDLKDQDATSRSARAEKAIQAFQSGSPSHIQFQTLFFDSTIHPEDYKPKNNAERGTDLAGALISLADGNPVSGFDGVILVTDGGDELIDISKLPSVPISIIGVGASMENIHDIGIGGINSPASVEENGEFDMEAELYARNGSVARIKDALASVKVTLEEWRDKRWVEIQAREVNLQSLLAPVSFHIRAEGGIGSHRYRLKLPEYPGELTFLNNTRTIDVQVQKRSLRVLYFTQELGADYKYLRAELASDSGISFTAMYRVLEDRFTIQGDRSGSEDLEKGFPVNEQALKRFDCIILGSFRVEFFTDPQLAALVKFVENGGALVCLGGENSFGSGGYAQSKLSPLFPWNLSKDEAPLITGNFPVTIPPSASAANFSSGLKEAIATAGGGFLDSINQPGSLKSGAISILEASVSGRQQSVIALQTYGKGQILGVASNTLWRWSAAGQGLKGIYGKFWRQAVRGLTRKLEGGNLLSIRWDRDHYRPGEQAQIEIRTNGSGDMANLRLTASLQQGDGAKSEITFSPVTGQAGVYAAKVPFTQRGDYVFRLQAFAGNQVAESYDRNFNVEPLVIEGGNPELKEAYLKDLAARGKGIYASEGDVTPIKNFLRTQILPHVSATNISLVEYKNIFLILLILVLITEWAVRRHQNLI